MILLGVLAGLTVLVLVIWHLPPELLRRQEAREHERLSFEQRLAAETELRRLLTEVCGAVLLLGGLVFAWQELQQTRHEATVRAERAERQLHGERYARAVAMLVAEHEIERVGGVTALAALADTEDAGMHWSAIQTLGVFVKEGVGLATCDTGAGAHAPTSSSESQRWALMALGGRGAPLDDAGLGMRRIGLRGADLQGQSLRGDLADWILQEACLHNADLGRCDLRRANLRRADLSHARLHGVTLDSGTQLQQANVRGACFAGATFEGQPAGMSWATFFADACVRGAQLPGDVRAPAAEPCERCPGR